MPRGALLTELQEEKKTITFFFRFFIKVDVKDYGMDAKGYMVDVKGYIVDAKGYMVDFNG